MSKEMLPLLYEIKKLITFQKKDFKYKFVSQRVSKKRELNKPLN